jgi:hypothetical protein
MGSRVPVSTGEIPTKLLDTGVGQGGVLIDTFEGSVNFDKGLRGKATGYPWKMGDSMLVVRKVTQMKNFTISVHTEGRKEGSAYTAWKRAQAKVKYQ